MITLHEGDCRSVLAALPDASAQCCVTSPPYYGLRDYGVSGQIRPAAKRGPWPIQGCDPVS